MLVLLTNFLSKHWKETIFAISLGMNVLLMSGEKTSSSSDIKNNIVITEETSEVEDDTVTTRKIIKKTTDLSTKKEKTVKSSPNRRFGVKLNTGNENDVEYNVGMRLWGPLWMDFGYTHKIKQTRAGISLEF